MKQGSPFGMVPTSAVFDERLSPFTLRVLMALATYADETRICHPGQGTIATRLKVTRPAINKAVGQLVRFGYIERTLRYRDDGGKSTSEYRIVFDQPPMSTENDIPMSTNDDIPMSTADDIPPTKPGKIPPMSTADDIPMKPHVDIPMKPHVDIRTDQYEQKREMVVKVSDEGEEEGASAPVVVGADPLLSQLCKDVAKAAHLAASADALERLCRRHLKTLSAEDIILEVEMAAEWIADPKRNKRKGTMNIAFLNGWLKRSATPAPMAISKQSAETSPSIRPVRDGRYSPLDKVPAAI